jgi:hypothetical protein
VFGPGGNTGDDALYDQAVAIVAKDRKGSPDRSATTKAAAGPDTARCVSLTARSI